MPGRKLLVGVSALALVAGGGAVAASAAPLAADPEGPKDCADVLPEVASSVRTPSVPTPAPAPAPNWAQRGGTINDASCLSRTEVAGIVAPRTSEEVAQALTYARGNGLAVSAAGVRHSMGGQAFRKGALILDMTAMNSIRLNAEQRTVTVGAGATWHQIQEAIHPQFSVKAMQSTDIFTVGGSISVNAHGMDHQAGALMGSIRAIEVMLADGEVVITSRTERPELFRLVVGGYGLFGVMLSATLDVVPNDIYRSERAVIDVSEFPATFEAIAEDRDIGLMYAHLSTAPGSFLRETIVYTYHRVDDAGLERSALAEASSTKLRRLVLNLSKGNDVFKATKWWAEKYIEPRIESCTVTRTQAIQDGEACLVSRNDPMHDSVPYLQNALPKETDILHEYFVPRDELLPFLAGLRSLLQEQHTNLLNASIRAVDAEDNVLTYAPQAAFSVVLYLNQQTDAEGTARMAKLTSDLIDLTARHEGRFFLPYQLHYSAEQLRAAYPQIGAFYASKRQWDPTGLLSNTWYAKFAPEIGQ